MTDSRRRFTGRERTALWLAADGRCESCGIELDPGWHADHVHPYSKGGPTDVINGAALCPPCNLKKGNMIMTDPRDQWQREAVSDFVSRMGDFLVTACPGAGKTRMALQAASALKESGAVTLIVVVVPTSELRQQWSREAGRFGLDLTANYSNSQGPLTAGTDGVIATYSQVARQSDLWRWHTARASTLVIFDEIHHAGEHDNGTWGPALKHAFEIASRRLLLSGTPFRTDGAKIPFVRYDDLGISVSDRGLTYGQGVRYGVVRPLRFEVLDGAGEWMDAGKRVAAKLSEASEEDMSDLLKTLYDPSQPWAGSVFQRADAELTRTREEMKDAGGLIVAASKWHAEQYAQLMTQVTGVRPAVVYSDMKDQDPGEIIGRFRSGEARWLIAVDMVSEGVDIPRLAVGVYMSRKRTEMWFRQIAGRFIRVRGDDDILTATIFIPQVPALVDMAERIEREADVALQEAEDEARERSNRDQREMTLSFIEPLATSEASLTQAILSGETIADAELQRAMLILQQVGGTLGTAHPADFAKALRIAGMTPTDQHVVPPVTVTLPAASGDDHRKALRRRLHRDVGSFCRRTGQSHKDVYYRLNAAVGGGSVPSASAEQLEKRIEVLHSWL